MLCHLIWVGSSTFSSRFHIVRTTYWTTTYFCLLSTGSNLQWLKPNQPFVQLNTLNLFSTDCPHQLFFSEGPTAACNPPLYCQPWATADLKRSPRHHTQLFFTDRPPTTHTSLQNQWLTATYTTQKAWKSPIWLACRQDCCLTKLQLVLWAPALSLYYRPSNKFIQVYRFFFGLEAPKLNTVPQMSSSECQYSKIDETSKQ